jgi:hypothetical protein
MIATEDIGRLAAKLLQKECSGKCIVELEGSQRVSPPAACSIFRSLKIEEGGTLK